METFTLKLDRRLEPGRVTCGKFDGTHACLAASTSVGNVLIHSPHREAPLEPDFRVLDEHKLTWQGEIAELQIGRQVTAIATGCLDDDERDVLFVGTASHVLAYQVEDNADLFRRELADGAYAIACGKLGWLQQPVLCVGGNCSITLLDQLGEEVFWTVARERVTALAVLDFDGDGANELLSGTRDYYLKAQREDAVLWEAKENAEVVELVALAERQFAYGTASPSSGTLGVYECGRIAWRIKSKHRVVAMRSFDLNNDGKPELVSGWSSGKLDARNASNGQVIFKIQLSAPVAGLIEADYRRTGRCDLVVATVNGEVRGYPSGAVQDTATTQAELYRELLAKKQSLQMELRQRNSSESNYFIGSKLAVSIASSNGAVRLGLASGPGLLIHYVMVFAEAVFEGESMVAHPAQPQGELEIALRFPKNGPIDVHVKTCVGGCQLEEQQTTQQQREDDVLMVLELTHQLPAFCMYEAIPRPDEVPPEVDASELVMDIAERAQRVALWLNQCLVLSAEIEVLDKGPRAGGLEIWLRAMRDQDVHCLRVDAAGKLTLKTRDAAFAGDVVQSLTTYLGLREATAEVRFVAEEQRMLRALDKFKSFKEVESQLQAEQAGTSDLVKNLVVHLEDSRIIEDPVGMRTYLTELRAVNGDLVRDHEIRSKSFGEMLAALKDLNAGVQNAARLRAGKAATNVVQRCRSAIKDENGKALLLALRHG
ncbi:Bardet-Biedl syndrome 2 protein homolog [Trichogramma pretiosum]|uniref:Bardet-Biedl syndrome 2 protein homolog n=1 Tax=Trichogramma pretiosum TaxID=7493 RepID=UPI0006C9BD6F|nr:Bardet-Biedl syndrome 2 protein homolog [Trichogramma pretiosum]